MPAWIEKTLGLGKADPGPKFAWHGRIAFACALIVLLILPFGASVFMSGAPPVDFIAFWAAGRLAAGGHAALAYNYAAHRAVEMSVSHMTGPMPFAYPPPFLLAVMPFSFQPLWLSYLLWVAVTAGLFLFASRRLLPSTYALAQPAAFMNTVGAQNGFLTGSVFVGATALIETRPLLAGALFGVFVCKPQLALLAPIALIAGREWRAVAGAALSALGLAAVAAALFGLQSYVGFLEMSRHFVAYLADGRWRWAQLASVYALARSVGCGNAVAMALQVLGALVAVVLTWRAWAQRVKQRVPILAAASLLVSPYLFTYDTLIMVVPIAWFLTAGQPRKVAGLWSACVLGVAAAMDVGSIPNVMPLAALLALWWLSSPE